MIVFLSFLLFLNFHSSAVAENLAADCPELTGRIVARDEPGYQKARLLSNFYTSKNLFPALIVYCQNTQDVQNAIKWATCHKMEIRIRSGGHNHEAFSSGNGVIVIDVSEMKQLQVDKSKNVAIVQPGITGGELYDKLYEIGLTQVGGTCSEVGISGLILTGGMGPLLRKHGLACDNVLYFEMVDAQGALIRATRDNEHKDLFWACCGGGAGNFGVVTSIAIKVYPAIPVTWFYIGWDWSAPVDKIINAWQNFFSNDDRRWFSHLDLWAKIFPAEKFHKEPIKVLGVFWGTPEEARKELAPLLKLGDPIELTIEHVSWNRAIKLFEESTSVFITDKPEYKSTAAFALKKLPKNAIKMIRESLQKTTSPLLNVLFFSLGGACQEILPRETAYFYRDAQFFITYSTQWLEEKDNIKQIGELDSLRAKLLPYTEGDYVGNPDRNLKDYLTAYYGENVHRLRCVKRRYDPHNVFHFEQSIPPEPHDCPLSAKLFPLRKHVR